MLTPKQNMLEVIKGGNPDRFVNQYEAVQLLFHPFMYANPLLQPGQKNVVNAWGVTNTFPKGVPGSFPVHTPDYSAFSSGNCEVQCGQRVALMSISLIQNGHFLVVGAAGSSFFAPREVTLFTALSRQKRMKAMMMKFTTDAMNEDANPDTS